MIGFSDAKICAGIEWNPFSQRTSGPPTTSSSSNKMQSGALRETFARSLHASSHVHRAETMAVPYVGDLEPLDSLKSGECAYMWLIVRYECLE